MALSRDGVSMSLLPCHLLYFQALGLAVSPASVCSDKKVARQQFIVNNWGKSLSHVLSSIDEHTAGYGKCSIPGHRMCRLTATRPDLALVGPPCQPWIEMRVTNGSTSKTGKPSAHPDCNILLEKVPAWLLARNPYGAIIEEVPGILKIDPTTGSAPIELVAQRLSEQFEGFEVVNLNADVWSTVARERTVYTHTAYGVIVVCRAFVSHVFLHVCVFTLPACLACLCPQAPCLPTLA